MHLYVTCNHCGQPTEHRYCCRYCRVAELLENAKFGRRLYLSTIRGEANEFPAYTSAFRSALHAAEALAHRVAPHAVVSLMLAVLATSCQKSPRIPTPQSTTSGIVATVGVSPWDFVSPFVCRMSATELTCMAAQDVRFRRGQLETQIDRGYQFGFSTPSGTGTGAVWFGCAGSNECGGGYFMFGSPSVSVKPIEPARFWNGGNPATVPYGSLGIVEVDIQNGQFSQIRNRWTGSIAPPQLKAGSGVVVSCTEQACTVSLK